MILAAAIVVAASACGGGSKAASPTATSAPESAFPLTIDGSDGQKLTLTQAPRRIVSLSAHATDILCAIGAGDQLLAVEKYANCPSNGQPKPELDSFEPNLEAIASYQPDLVYVSSDTGNVVEALRRTGTSVLYLTLPSSVADVMAQIELFGQATGHASEAASVEHGLQQRIDAVKQELADVTAGPRVFHEVDSTYYTASPNSFIGDFYKILKADNIAAGATDEYPQLSAEVIVQRNPDVIVLADEAAGVTADSVAARPGWDAISAVKSRRICAIDASLISQPGTKIADAVEALAKCLYPDRFK
jgi:iron complex transport system substrate-binding protein